jgi:hypothetical protein
MLYFGTYHRLRLHVSATPKQVLRALYKKLRPRAFTRDQRVHRHAIARDILECHCSARTLFRVIYEN